MTFNGTTGKVGEWRGLATNRRLSELLLLCCCQLSKMLLISIFRYFSSNLALSCILYGPLIYPLWENSIGFLTLIIGLNDFYISKKTSKGVYRKCFFPYVISGFYKCLPFHIQNNILKYIILNNIFLDCFSCNVLNSTWCIRRYYQHSYKV